MTITLYDTTLRDGIQQEGLSLSVEDKVRIASLLDRMKVDFIEGGWPGSNPKDAVFFERAAQLSLHHARLAAFGSTRRANVRVENDPNVRALLDAGTSVVTVFGKAWGLHIDRVLRTTREENLRMIHDTVRYLRENGRTVIYDAEHFFDGYRTDSEYALETLTTAVDAGAESVVLCDTNGGSMPWDVEQIVRSAAERIDVHLGIHAHNDAGLAVANTLAAVRAGASHVQGTVNGYGERCGNADLCSIIPTLVLKLDYDCTASRELHHLTGLSEAISEIANRQPDPQRPYVGRSAFAHKGGIHVDALAKCPESYQHEDPEHVGNRCRFVISELSGRANIAEKAREFGLVLPPKGGRTQRVLSLIKDLEHRGFQFEGAEASTELLIRRTDPSYHAPFELTGFHVLVREQAENGMLSEAAVKIAIGDHRMHTAAEGNGPVNALDRAVRKALLPIYPQLEEVKLVDYKVRILDGDAGTAARIRVLITSSDGQRTWSTVGCGTNVIEASWIALADALEYALIGITARQLEPLEG